VTLACDSLCISCLSFVSFICRFSEEPTEEEKAEMGRVYDKATGKNQDSLETDPDVAKLVGHQKIGLEGG
jgi:hypothetical protein